MKDGLLHKNNEAVFGIGMSYYASFYPGKAPVADEKRREAEMELDLERMREFGVNLFRCAALGKVFRENSTVVCDTPLIDAMLKKAEKEDLAVIVRLQGYHADISGNEGFKMLDETGRAVSPNKWNAFIQNCLHHKGILRDNHDLTAALTKHFSKFPPFIAFCVYNEPHYPGGGLYDYHPDAVAAYRDSIGEKDCGPPKERPGSDGKNIFEWIKWRMFCMESLSSFLKATFEVSKAVNPDLAGMTAAVTTDFRQGNDAVCSDNFSYAAGMDVCAFTDYSPSRGISYYKKAMTHDFLESCAAVAGKHTWIAEYDARTNITIDSFERETYIAVGGGAKGILYYQWRGDDPSGVTEEGNAFGMLHYDGSKTEHFEEKKKMVRLLHEYSPYIVNAQKLRSKIAILHSDHMNFFHCAHQKKGFYVASAYETSMFGIYMDFVRMGFSVDFVKAEHLSGNKLGIQFLFIPEFDYMLSEKEAKDVARFRQNGGRVFMYAGGGYNEMGRPPGSILNGDNNGLRSAWDIAELEGMRPHIKMTGSDILEYKALKGDGYYFVSLCNISTLDKKAENAKLKCNFNVTSALCATPYAKKDLTVENDEILLPVIATGAFVLIHGG